jgi:hypothetical protein
MAVDEDNNIPVAILGGDAVLATDIVQNAGVTSHVQIIKAAWGDDNYSYKTNESTPMPVRLYGSSGDRIAVTGGVFGYGTFVVGNSFSQPIYVANGISGPLAITGGIQGITNGVRVGVTGSVFILGSVGITGLVSTTGGRALTFGTDSIRVYGEIGTTRAWTLTAANDTVKVSPFQGGSTHSTYIAGSNGTAIGSSGDALKVFVSNLGLSLTANIDPIVGIKNVTGDILRVMGNTWTSLTNPTPVVVRGTKASESASAGNNPGDMIVSFSIPQQVTVVGSASVDTDRRSNLYGLFVGATGSGNTATVGVNAANISTAISAINTRLNSTIPARIRNETSESNSVRTWSITLTPTTPVVSLANPQNPALVPVHGTHIKNQTHILAALIGQAGTPISIATGNQHPGYILEPGESIFIPMSVNTLTAAPGPSTSAAGILSSALAILSI